MHTKFDKKKTKTRENSNNTCVTIFFLHVAFLHVTWFFCSRTCKCSVAENGVIDSPRNHKAVYRQLT